ncbi:TolC family protein [Zunongwangia endophytica]|uniref:TolC family protein n=1 Tax=Zunongwangia endophytica TaxID=1808945 RepID=A0ABV8H5F5_9FLAO|nr:TolC family protein [Zunongwangia endophytica]MDN3595156.1 TolC family protein [Zunongwangia endophytica]
MTIYKIITRLFCVSVFLLSLNSTAQNIKIELDAAKKMALSNNREIKQANEELKGAFEALSSAKAANKPSLEASVVGLYLGEPMQTMLPETSVNGSLVLSEVLYAGGKIRNRKKLAQSSVQLQTSQQELTQQEILLETETQYWNLVSIYEKVNLAKKSLKLLDTLHTDLTNKYNAGFINKNDVLRVKVRLNNAQITLQEAKDGLIVSKYSFAQLIGLNTMDFILEDEFNELEIIPKNIEDPSEFVNQRPEINMLEESVQIQNIQTDLLKADRKPSLSVAVNGIYSAGKQIDFSDGSDSFTSAIGLVNLSIPIFDWGGRKHKVAEQQAEVKVQKLKLENTKEELGIEIKNASLSLNRSILEVKLSEESLEQAQENLRLLKNQFDSGIITGKDVLEGQVLWQKAYANLIETKATLKINEAKYKKAIADY